MMYLGGFVNIIDYKVNSMNASDLDKLFQNLTPEYLGSKDFDTNGEEYFLKNTINLSNLLS